MLPDHVCQLGSRQGWEREGFPTAHEQVRHRDARNLALAGPIDSSPMGLGAGRPHG